MKRFIKSRMIFALGENTGGCDPSAIDEAKSRHSADAEHH
jgi:hypothetical protein